MAPPDARLLQLALAIAVELPNQTREKPCDVVIEAQHDATVGDLVAALAEYLEEEPRPTFSLFRSYRATRDAVDDQGIIAGYLPDIPLMFCSLVDGTLLRLRDRSVSPGPSLPIDTGRGLQDLFLVDDRGTHRGRVTRLPVGVPVAVGSEPPAARCVVVDDETVPPLAFSVCNRAGEAVECTVTDPANLFVAGAPAVAGTIDLLPGSTVTFRPADTDIAAFTVTTPAGLGGRSPAGKVQFDPSAPIAAPAFPVQSERSLRIHAAPKPPEHRPLPLEQLMLPVVMAVVIFLVTRSLYTLAIAPITAAFPLLSYRRQQREIKQRYHEDRQSWVNGLQRINEDLAKATGVEEENLTRLAPRSDQWGVQAYRRLAGTWSRTSGRQDFLVARIGSADAPSRYVTKLDPELDSADEDFIRVMEHHGRTVVQDAVQPQLFNVPVAVSLRQEHVALTGPVAVANSLATDVLVQTACGHPPGALGIAALLPDSAYARDAYDWLKWLPHTVAGSVLLPNERVILGRQRCNKFLADLAAIQAERSDHTPDEDEAYALLVVHEAAEVNIALLENACEAAGGRIRLLWVGTSADNAPQLSSTVVAVTQLPDGHLVGDIRSGPDELLGLSIRIDQFLTQPIRVARSLAPLYDPQSSGANAGIPSTVNLSAVIPTNTVERTDSDISKSCRVALGLHDQGVFELDLVHDGPHVLIGGTTGAGKSELLQTLVAGLLARYSPSDVNFFLIDFKGGATFAPFRGLPHVIGYVSDLDRLNVRRALAFLLAELRSREQLFNEAGNAKDYRSYVAAMAQADATSRLPRLVVIFDEFGALAQDQQFQQSTMNTVIDIAQRGRSLGVHIVFATQQPSPDVIPRKVRANVRAAIALHTLNAADSDLIIGRSDAARIPRALPGRALVRLGEEQLIEFQTAFGGAPAETEHSKPVHLMPLEPGLPRSSGRRRLSSGDAAARLTELEQLLKVHSSQGEARNSLSKVLAEALEVAPKRPVPALSEKGQNLHVAIGLRDVPEQQERQPVTVDLKKGGLLVAGPPTSGRTSALVLMTDLFSRGRDAESPVGIVAFDPAQHLSHELLQRSGDVACVPMTNTEQLTRAIDQLDAILAARMDADTTDIGIAYQQPHDLLILIDGFDVLTRVLAGIRGPWHARLVQVLTLGRRYGMYAAIASASERDVDVAVAAAQHAVIRLHAHYDELHIDSGRLPGFGLDRHGYLVQLYLSEPRDLCRIDPLFGRFLDQDAWREPLYPATAYGPDVVSLGTAEVTRSPLIVSLTEAHILVIGRSHSGRTSLLRALAAQLTAVQQKPVLVLPMGRPWPEDVHTSLALNDDEIAKLKGHSRDDQVRMLESYGVARLSDGRFPIFIDDAYATKDTTRNNETAASALGELFDRSVIQPIAATIAQSLGSSPLTTAMKTEGYTIYLRLSAIGADIDDGIRVRSATLQHRPGRSYRRNDAIVQTDYGQVVVHLPVTEKEDIA